MEETNMDENEQSRETEVAPALIAVHPNHDSVAVSVGSDLRVFNLLRGHSESLLVDSGGNMHKDSIRAIRYGAEGKLFVSAGDDKLVKIWNTDSWRCTHTILSEKRVSAVAISKDGCFVCFADKFGMVYATDLDSSQEKRDIPDKKPVSILSHYCSIITSLEFSPDGRFIISADRDFKIRVTLFPQNPLNGAHEIQSFCLGHTEFVSCLTFVCNQDFPQGFLVSGGGDSTVSEIDKSDTPYIASMNVKGQPCAPSARCLVGLGKETLHMHTVVPGQFLPRGCFHGCSNPRPFGHHRSK